MGFVYITKDFSFDNYEGKGMNTATFNIMHCRVTINMNNWPEGLDFLF